MTLFLVLHSTSITMAAYSRISSLSIHAGKPRFIESKPFVQAFKLPSWNLSVRISQGEHHHKNFENSNSHSKWNTVSSQLPHSKQLVLLIGKIQFNLLLVANALDAACYQNIFSYDAILSSIRVSKSYSG